MHLRCGVLRFPALAPVIVLSSPGWLRLIAAFKLVKAVLCIAVALGALQMLRPELAVRAQQTMEAVAMHIDRRWAGHLIDWFSRQPLNRFQVIAIVAFLYAALFLTEGVGLWKEKRWAARIAWRFCFLACPFRICLGDSRYHECPKHGAAFGGQARFLCGSCGRRHLLPAG